MAVFLLFVFRHFFVKGGVDIHRLQSFHDHILLSYFLYVVILVAQSEESNFRRSFERRALGWRSADTLVFLVILLRLNRRVHWI